MAVARDQISIPLENISRNLDRLQFLEEEGLSPRAAAFQECLRGMKTLVANHGVRRPKILISYAWEEQGSFKLSQLHHFLIRLKTDLQTLGMSVFLDLEKMTGDMKVRMQQEIASSDYFLIIGTALYRQKALNATTNVAFEYQHITQKISQSVEPEKSRMLLPVWYGDTFTDAFPDEVAQHFVRDFRDRANYHWTLIGLMNPMGLVPHCYPSFAVEGDLGLEYKTLVNSFKNRLDYLNERQKTLMSQRDIQAEALSALRANYCSENNRQIQRLFGQPLELDKSYVNLSMIKSHVSEKKEAQSIDSESNPKAHKTQDERLSSFEDLLGQKEAIAVVDLFKPETPQAPVPKRLLIQGRAGIGKTTFSAYLAYRWASGQLWQQEFEWVFKITLRNLSQGAIYQKPCSVQTIIHQECLSDLDPIAFEQLWKQVLSKSSKVLLILDGLDEIGSITEDPGHPLHSAMKSFIWSDYFLILTSRPYGLSTVPSARRDLEIIGFTSENIEQYAQAFFRDLGASQSLSLREELTRQGNALLGFLKSNPSLWGIAHIPVALNIICGVCQQSAKSVESCATLTALYQVMEQKLLELDYLKQPAARKSIFLKMTAQEKETALKTHYALALKFLGGLAYQGMQKKALILQPDWIATELEYLSNDSVEQIIALFESAAGLGFIKPTQVLRKDLQHPREQPHEFLHFSFQEYFTARYIADKISKKDPEILEFVREQKFNPRYQMVWWFVGGLMKPKLSAYLSLLEEPETQDIIGQYSLSLQARIMEEAYDKKDLKTMALLEPIRVRIQKEILKLYKQYQQYGEPFCSKSRLLSMLRLNPQLIDCAGAQDLGGLLSLEATSNKRAVIDFLSILGLATPKVLGSLTGYLKDKDDDKAVRGATARAIGALGRAAATPEVLSGLVLYLRDSEEDVRLAAAEAIGALGAAAARPDVLSELMLCLQDSTWDVSWAAAEAIGALGVAAATPEVLSGLLLCLQDSDKYVRGATARAIGALGVAAATPEVLSELVLCLQAIEEDVRENAAWAIGALGVAAATPELLSGLVLCLQDSEGYVRMASAKAIKALGTVAATPEVLSGLVFCVGFQCSGYDVRLAAVYAIEALGVAAATPELLSGLVLCLQYSTWDVRSAAAWAIGALGVAAATPEVLSELVLCLQDSEGYVREDAAHAIGALGRAAARPEVLSRLVLYLRDSEEDVRMAAAHAIGALGVAAATPEVLSGLVLCLHDSDKYVRKNAARAIGALGVAAATPEVLSELVLCLYSTWGVRLAAVEAIGALGVAAATPEVLIGLLICLREGSNGAVASAIEALGAVATPEFLGELVLSLQRSDEDISEPVAEAIIYLSQHLILLYKSWHAQSVTAITIENLSYFRDLMIIGYMSNQLSIQVFSKATTELQCRGYLDKTPFFLNLSPAQGVCLKHLAPKILEQWKTDGEILSGEILLQHYQMFSQTLNRPSFTPIYHMRTNNKHTAFESDTRYQRLVDALLQSNQRLKLESDNKNLMVILEAEGFSSGIARQWLKKFSQFLEAHYATHLAPMPFNIDSDEICHLLTIATKSSLHRSKLEESLKSLSLFQTKEASVGRMPQ